MNQEWQPDDQAFVNRAKAVLDQAAGDVDQAAVLRLQRARLSTLEGRRQAPWNYWVSGLVAASVAAVALTLWLRPPAPVHQAVVPIEDVELVLSLENVELADDLEFYHWLAGDDTQG